MALTCLFGGTFNPVHNGHLFLAEEALHALGLKRVVFVPNRLPPHKESPSITASDRLKMLEAAVEGIDAFEVNRVELEREGRSYTIDTLETYPPEARLAFLCGADAFLYNWHRLPDVLTRLEHLVIANRAGFDFKLPPQLAALPENLRNKIRLLEFPDIAISSSEIRRRVSEGRAYRFLLPEPVYRMICHSRFYSEPGQDSGKKV